MKFCKVRDVRSPLRAHSNDAGIDFYIPKYSEEFKIKLKELNPRLWIDDKGIEIASGEKIIIPSGIKVKVPEGYALIAFDKSGVATKKGLLLLAKVVDESYLGEVIITMVNTSRDLSILEYDSKLIQMILIPMFYDTTEEISIDEYEKFSSARGDGGFGSTN